MDPRDDLRPPVSETAEVVRSEEELHLGTRIVPRERVRLVKRIVSETVTRTFEVRREELVVERAALDDSVTDADDALSNDEALEIILHEEQVELVTRVVPRERVRVYVELIAEEHAVSETVRREQVEVETDASLGSSSSQATPL